MKKSDPELPKASEDAAHKKRVSRLVARASGQSQKFIEAAKNAGCDDDEDSFDRRIKKIALPRNEITKKPAK
jgi:hypothetical protein